MTMTKEELREAIGRFLETGDEKVIEAFVLEHFAELPEDVQKELLFTFYADALEKEAGKGAISALQIEGLEAMDTLEAIKAALEKK